MTNQEAKQAHWDNISYRYEHLKTFCTVELKGIEKDDIYYHPTFNVGNQLRITTQADISSNAHVGLYAVRVHLLHEGTFEQSTFVEISEDLLESVIMGWAANRLKVSSALHILEGLRVHINNVHNYVEDYIRNLLMSNSVEKVTEQMINELKAINLAVKLTEDAKRNDT